MCELCCVGAADCGFGGQAGPASEELRQLLQASFKRRLLRATSSSRRDAAPARPASVNGVGSRAIRDTSGRRSRRKTSTSGWITRSACAPIVAAAPRRSISRRESCSRWKSSRRRPRSASIAARPATAGVARRRTTPRFPRPVAQRVRQSQRQPGRRLRPTADRVARASGAQRRRNGPQGKRPD